MPTWKRLKIVHGLIWYRNHVRRSRTPRLEHLRAKLQETVIDVGFVQQDRTIEEAVGKCICELGAAALVRHRVSKHVDR